MQRLIGFVAVVLAVGLACDSPSEEVAGGRAMAALEAGWAPDLAAVEVATLSEHHPNEAFPASKTRTELWVGPRAWPDDHRASLLVRFDASQVQSALDAGGSVQLVIPLVDDGDNEGFWLQRMKPRRQAWRGASVTWACADDRAPLEPRFACHAKQRWLVADCDEREPPPTCPWGSKCSDPSPACAYVETLKGVVAGGDVVEVDGLPFEKAIVFDFTSEAEWAVTNGVMDLSWLVGGGDGSAMATVMAGSGAAPNRPHLRWALAGPDAGSPDGGMAWPEDSGTVVSPDVEDCDNGLDDDGDGDVDCDDADCAADHRCIAEDCTSARDDDGDGAIDCADTECGASPECEVPASPAAPPLPPGESAAVSDAYSFLQEGADPAQKGVGPAGIDPERGALVYGRVRGRDGAPIPGVRVSVLNHPEVGWTHTRSNGRFDLLAEGIPFEHC